MAEAAQVSDRLNAGFTFQRLPARLHHSNWEDLCYLAEFRVFQ